MKRYFRGNTRARRLRMEKIHKKFKAHQRRWIFRSFGKNLKYWR